MTPSDPEPESVGTPIDDPDTLAALRERIERLAADNERLGERLGQRLAEHEEDRGDEWVAAQRLGIVGRLVPGVAHELNNSLAAIVAFGDLLRRDPQMPQELRDDADMLAGEAERTTRIIANMLGFAGEHPPERHPTSLRPLLQSVVDLLAYPLRGARIAVDIDVSPDLPAVEIDRQQLQQVFLNLLQNSIRAIGDAKRSGHVTLRAAADPQIPERVRIEVIDDGSGVPPDRAGGLFPPHLGGLPSGEVVGLGLPVSFAIVARHGGRLSYQAVEPGPGARFVVELPTRAGDAVGRDATLSAAGVRPHTPHPTAAAATLAATTAAAATTPPVDTIEAEQRPRIIVIDDQAPIRVYLVKALRAVGLEPTAAASGAEAIELARSGTFDLVLCDYRLADMSGTDVYEAIGRLRPELAARFIFMSGDIQTPQLREFADERGVLLLAKPFDIETIGRSVREVLARPA